MRLLALVLATACAAAAYPLDGAEATGIRRLVGYKLAAEGKINRTIALKPGCYLSTEDIRLHLHGANDDFDLGPATPRDPELQAGLEKVMAGRDPSYSIALLDISNPLRPRFAAVRPEVKRIPGSLGKLLVATGFFDALRLRFPGDTDARRTFLRDTKITADAFVHTDGKTVPLYDAQTKTLTNRRVETGDVFNLYEWLDHMLSQSSNAAGSEVWKEAILLRKFGADYPLTAAQQEKFLSETPKTELRDMALSTLETPLHDAGIDTDNLRLGTMFTRNGSARIPGTASYGSPWELMRWLIKLEQGKIVDEWSSLEIKKLLYFTRPRYRYASSPALDDAAVFFKSGSLFQCEPEEGYTCKAYAGNKLNLMHSVAIVERPGQVYLVTMTSDVRKVNGAVEHQTMATLIDRLLRK
ncbi:MAG: hypothetical protein GC160_02075 [Acidobacteria bacterium]|nr:hypothetical protein [Acidobacteriota bacterium]